MLETGFTTPQYLSDYYVEDASFLRMDNITLGYRFDYRGQPLRVFGTLQNAFTITGLQRRRSDGGTQRASTTTSIHARARSPAGLTSGSEADHESLRGTET